MRATGAEAVDNGFDPNYFARYSLASPEQDYFGELGGAIGTGIGRGMRKSKSGNSSAQVYDDEEMKALKRAQMADAYGAQMADYYGSGSGGPGNDPGY